MEEQMRGIDALQRWYSEQTDGWWEHSNGITIETLDNPGWSMRIDLEGTSLAGASFERVTDDESDQDWIRCWVEHGTFRGVGGPQNLCDIVRVFLQWAERVD